MEQEREASACAGSAACLAARPEPNGGRFKNTGVSFSGGGGPPFATFFFLLCPKFVEGHQVALALLLTNGSNCGPSLWSRSRFNAFVPLHVTELHYCYSYSGGGHKFKS